MLKALFLSINGWVFDVKICLANIMQFSRRQVKILNLKHDIKHHHQWKNLNLQLLLWNWQTISSSNLIAAVSGDQWNCNDWNFSVQLYWFHIVNESYHTRITFELEERRIVHQGHDYKVYFHFFVSSILSFLLLPKKHEKFIVSGSNINF